MSDRIVPVLVLLLLALAAVWGLFYVEHLMHMVTPPEYGGAAVFDGEWHWQDVPLVASFLLIFIVLGVAITAIMDA